MRTGPFCLLLLLVSVAACSDPVPQILRFEASPAVVAAGLSTTLSWQTDGADTVEISPEVGPVGGSGAVVLSPVGTTTYVLLARGGGGEDSRSVTVTREPAPDGGPVTAQQTIVVSREGDGTGRVQSTPPGIDCGSTCSGLFPVSPAVHLVATPAPGSTFLGWMGACQGGGECVLEGNSSLHAIAVFGLVKGRHKLEVKVVGHGKVIGQMIMGHPPLISCAPTCGALYLDGEQETLHFEPVDPRPPLQLSAFVGWQGCDQVIGADCAVILTQDKVVTATFKDVSCRLDSTCQSECLSSCLAGGGLYSKCVPACIEECRICT